MQENPLDAVEICLYGQVFSVENPVFLHYKTQTPGVEHAFKHIDTL